MNEAARDWLSGVLGAGLPGSLGGLSLEADRVRLSLATPAGPLEAWLSDPRGAGPHFLRSEAVGIAYSGGILDPAREALLRAILQRLAGVPYPRLRAELDARADTPPVRARAPAPGAAVKPRLASFFMRVDRADDWSRFVVPERPFLDSRIALPPGGIQLQHGSRECLFNDFHAPIAAVRLFSDGALMNDPARASRFWFTDIGEQEVLAGRTQAHLRGALEEVTEALRPSMVHLATTCLPELIGEDPRPVIQGHRERCPVLWTSKTLSSGGSVTAHVQAALRSIPFEPRRDPSLVLVAGVQDEPDRREVDRLLSRLGLRSAGHLLPALDPARLPDLPRASRVVWGSGFGWGAVAEALFEGVLPSVRPPAPVGVSGTLAWAAEVATAAGTADAEDRLGALRAEMDEALAGLRREAAGCRVALAGSRADLAILLGDEFYGFPVARVLVELGFDVRFLVREDPAQGPGPAPLPGSGVPTMGFSTRQELDALLGSEADVVFSHFHLDPRLQAHGLRGFCQDAFGLGVDGALRAGRRLLSLSRRRWAAPLRGFLGGWIR